MDGLTIICTLVIVVSVLGLVTIALVIKRDKPIMDARKQLVEYIEQTRKTVDIISKELEETRKAFDKTTFIDEKHCLILKLEGLEYRWERDTERLRALEVQLIKYDALHNIKS